MDIKRILTIKNYHNKGGDLSIKLESHKVENQNRLSVSRWPDQYSSRLGMMANLNKDSHSLSWGFTEMRLTIKKFSDTGELISYQFYVFTRVAVEHFLSRDSYELITFAFNEKSEFCIGQC